MAAQAAEAFNSSNYAEAITLFSQLLNQYPSTLDYYIKRSTAYQRTQNFPAALSDTEIAVMLANKRGKKDVLAQAQLRRGIALYMLERYGDAMVCFEHVKKVNEKERGLEIWIGKAKKGLAGLPPDDERRDGGVKEIPDVEVPKSGVLAKGKESEKSKSSGEATPATAPAAAAAAAAAPTPADAQTPASKIRHEWYQTSETIVFSLLAKGVPKEKASIEIQEDSLSISFPLASGSTYDFSLDPLYAPVDPSASTLKIMSTKIELILKKATPGQKWHALEGIVLDKGKGKATDTTTTISALPAQPKPTESGPSYPTSSKKGPKNWDKLAADLTKPKKASSSSTAEASTSDGKDDDLTIDDDDDDGGDPVNSFFKKLYKSADPDTRRAMIKSYQESNGTALSTNWGEVGKGKVEVSPPDGMVAKKWDE